MQTIEKHVVQSTFTDSGDSADRLSRELSQNDAMTEIQVREQFLLMGVSWMPKALAMSELDRLKAEYELAYQSKLEDVLDTAHEHYMEIIGVSFGMIEPEVLEEDREIYRGLLKEEGGTFLIEEHQCVRFMSERYNLRMDICAAYVCSKGLS